MNAIGYCRVSTERQADEGISLDAQRQKIIDYCRLKDLTLTEIIVDAGKSAKTLDRPGLKRLFAMADARGCDAIVVAKLDRLFRNTRDAIETSQHFRDIGIALHSIAETLDTRSAMGTFFFSIMAALGQLERDIISERTKDALAHKRTTGMKTGGHVPYGYTADSEGRLTPFDYEQGAIRAIMHAHKLGATLRAICHALTVDGFCTRTGNTKWDHSVVAAIIRRGEKETKGA